MRWFRGWLRSIAALVLIVPSFLFALLIVIDNNFKHNYFYDKTSYTLEPKFKNNDLREQAFKPMFQLRRNSTSGSVNEWQSSVDFHQLLDIKDFDFKRNGSHLCAQQTQPTQPFLVTLVHSSPKNFVKREVIRKTWGSLKSANGYQIVLVFILGLVNDSNVERLLDKEWQIHKDLVVAKFVDTYHNLTYKHLTSYKWVLSFCKTTKFVMKADDDSFVDVFRAVKVLRETFYTSAEDQSDYSPRNIIACSLFPEGTTPKRSGKWSLTFEEYPYRTFPSYCSGVAYFFTPDISFDILEAAHQIKPVLRIDDVFLTGVVTAYLNIQPFPLNLKYAYDDKKLRNWLYDSNTRPNPYMIADIGNVGDWQSLMNRLWTKTIRCWT